MLGRWRVNRSNSRLLTLCCIWVLYGPYVCVDSTFDMGMIHTNKKRNYIVTLTFEDKILAALQDTPMKQMSLWACADVIYDNCMARPRPGNGAKVSNIRRAAEKSDKLIYWPGSNGSQYIGIKNEI